MATIPALRSVHEYPSSAKGVATFVHDRYAYYLACWKNNPENYAAGSKAALLQEILLLITGCREPDEIKAAIDAIPSDQPVGRDREQSLIQLTE